MKGLFFAAAAGHPNVVPALMGQADASLRPFNNYLRQAIKTARERQFRYQLPWEPVPRERILKLEPLDTWLVISKPSPGVIITNWPADREPPVDKPLYEVESGEAVPVQRVEARTDGLWLALASEWSPSGPVLWGGVQCEFAHTGPDSSPRHLEGPEGQALTVQRVDDSLPDVWRVLVRGLLEEGVAIRADGRAVEAVREAPLAGLRTVVDSANVEWRVGDGCLKEETLPAEGELRGNNGIRFRWSERGTGRDQGTWIQLLPGEGNDSDEFLDPRAAFCEDEVKEVWTSRKRHEGEVIAVKRVDRDRYRLLVKTLPAQGEQLFLPLNVRNLELQRRAIHQLSQAPLPHHQGLLRLCENPAKSRWPDVAPAAPNQWFVLKDLSRSGTDQQRDFVARALGGMGAQTGPDEGDFTLLEGPPGSGKTTAICELVLQLVARGKRVLLCGTTHYSVDNVLERLVGGEHAIDALRVGRLEKVDSAVEATQLDNRVEALVDAWRGRAGFEGLNDKALAAMAERTVTMSADLTCGTTTGIANHPFFRDAGPDYRAWERPITTSAWWDVLIIDEASKTTVQEFLVPAMMARRWVIVGDVQQLPPFTERSDIVANLRSLGDERDGEIFPAHAQRARLVRWRLDRHQLRQGGLRFLIVEPASVLDALERELNDAESGYVSAVRITAGASKVTEATVPRVCVEDIVSGQATALLLSGVRWVLVPDDLLVAVEACLPGDLLSSRRLDLQETATWRFRQAHWLDCAPRLEHEVRERGAGSQAWAKLEVAESGWLAEHDWAVEVAWRLTRAHELRLSHEPKERERYQADIVELLPADKRVKDAVSEIQDVGLPGIIEVIQDGIGEKRSNRASILTAGLRTSLPRAFETRFTSLSWQHRMHADISSFPRDLFYKQRSLQDANTIASRDLELGWDFAPELAARRVWLHVLGEEHGGENRAEVEMMAARVRAFIAWAQRKGPPGGGRPPHWELACLTFYTKQESLIGQMLQSVTGVQSRTRFSVPNVELVCGTVDRFQGREADVVLLSMRNTRRVGFLDSVNRLNVAVTRARQQLMVVGNYDYFEKCKTSELRELAARSRRIDGCPAERASGGKR